MKVHVNEKYIRRRAAIGRWASLVGLLILIAGFIVSLRDPSLYYVAFATLVVGFVLSNVGIYYANRYVRPDRPDAVLVDALKGLDKRFALYQFLLPVSQLLREPGGLTVFLLKPQEGEILYENGRWRNKQGWGRLLRWVGQEGLGRPDQELEGEVQKIENWLERNAPELDAPVRGVVLFTNPKAEVVLEESPPVSAMVPKQVKGWLRKSGRLTPLSDETQQQLKEVLNQAAGVGEEQDEE
jgi:hypothetical protein